MHSQPHCSRLSIPFAHLNLRSNPFGELPLQQRADVAVVDLDQMIRFLEDPYAAIQLMGEKGRGKTTHLMALQAHYGSSAYVWIDESRRPIIPTGDPLLIDEAQRLPWWIRRPLFRRRVRLVLGTHSDLAPALRRAGRTVDTIHVESQMSTERLGCLLNRRIDYFRRTDGPIPWISPRNVVQLQTRFGSNIRSIEDYLYHRFQELEGPCDVQV